jgi:hypothetical protein
MGIRTLWSNAHSKVGMARCGIIFFVLVQFELEQNAGGVG